MNHESLAAGDPSIDGQKLVVAVIPARGGSKGVPGKNLARVGGVPLVGRTVTTAQRVPAVSLVFVSTDDPSIAAVAREFGAELIQRPAHLSGDTATSESALVHALDEIRSRGLNPDVVIFMQATSPFVDPSNLVKAVSRVQAGEYDCVFSAVSFHGFVWQQAGSGAVGVNHDESVRLRRQERHPEFLETGAFYVMKAEGFRTCGHRFFGRVGIETVSDWSAIEIDTENDLEMARTLAPIVDTSDWPIRVRALIMDFDGVHTDNRAMVDAGGNEAAVVNRADGMGIERLKGADIPLLIISKERTQIVLRRAEKLGVEAICGVDDKEIRLRDWCNERSISLGEVAYVGNDVNDLACLSAVGWPIAVADAHPLVKRAARIVLHAAGGAGAIREVSDRILSI